MWIYLFLDRKQAEDEKKLEHWRWQLQKNQTRMSRKENKQKNDLSGDTLYVAEQALLDLLRRFNEPF